MSTDHGNLQKYLNKNPVQRLLLRRFLKSVSMMASSVEAATVLDAGSGEGFVAEMFRLKRIGSFFVEADLDWQALTHGQLWHPQITFTQADLHHLPLPDHSIDLTLCLEVLEHSADPSQALTELCRVSRGHLLLSMPHEPWFRAMNFLRGKNLARWGDDPEHVNHWNVRSFLRFVRPKVDIVSIERSFPWFIVLGRARG